MKVQTLLEDSEDGVIKKLLLDVQRWVIEDGNNVAVSDPELDFDKHNGRFQLEYVLKLDDGDEGIRATVIVAIDQDCAHQAIVSIEPEYKNYEIDDELTEHCDANFSAIIGTIEALCEKLYELFTNDEDSSEDDEEDSEKE